MKSKKRTATSRRYRAVVRATKRRRPSIHLPPEEYAFHTLPEGQLEACLDYECHRERARRQFSTILKEAAEIDKLDESEDEKFRQKLELQSELDALKESLRPWLSLTPTEREHHLQKSAIKPTRRPEPVRFHSDLGKLQQVLTRGSSRWERLDIVVDWEASKKALVESFAKLVDRLRGTPGTKAHGCPVNEKRGNQPSVPQCLYQLVVWRCREAKFNAFKTMQILNRLRPCCPIPSEESFLNKFVEVARAGERLVFDGPG